MQILALLRQAADCPATGHGGRTSRIDIKHWNNKRFSHPGRLFKPGRMKPTRSDSPRHPELTEIERRCLDLAARGRTPADIAFETDIALPRIAEAMRNAVDKLGARNVTGAITRALRLDLI